MARSGRVLQAWAPANVSKTPHKEWRGNLEAQHEIAYPHKLLLTVSYTIVNYIVQSGISLVLLTRYYMLMMGVLRQIMVGRCPLSPFYIEENSVSSELQSLVTMSPSELVQWYQ